MFYGIQLSIIAVPSLILAKKPNAKELLDKIEPYQGWIGLIFCLGGVWGVISSVLNMGWITSYPIWWITLLAGSLVQAVLGFMLGFGMINKLILSKNETAQQKAEALREKLAPKLGKLGVFGLIVGAWMIVASLLFFM
jgi:ABC-type multidrug transport system permease subunit